MCTGAQGLTLCSGPLCHVTDVTVPLPMEPRIIPMSSQMKVPEVIPADPIKIGIKMGSRSQMGPRRVPSGSQEGPMGPDPGHIWDALGPGSISTVHGACCAIIGSRHWSLACAPHTRYGCGRARRSGQACLGLCQTGSAPHSSCLCSASSVGPLQLATQAAQSAATSPCGWGKRSKH